MDIYKAVQLGKWKKNLTNPDKKVCLYHIFFSNHSEFL